MAPGKFTWLAGSAILTPCGFALVLAVLGEASRVRRFMAVLYALVTGSLCGLLINGFLKGVDRPAFASLKFNRLNFPVVMALMLLSCAALLYASFRRAQTERPGLLAATIPSAAVLASLTALASSDLLLAVAWLGVTAAAGVGLLAHGTGGGRARLRAFSGWLAGDALFLLGLVLARVLLDESEVFIRPPLTRGGEAAVIAVAARSLAAVLIRLGAFPFGFWVEGLVSRTDAAWSSFFVGCVNFILAGFRLLVVLMLVGRLVSADWRVPLLITGLASVFAGPLFALRCRKTTGFLAGMYTFQAGYLVFAAGLYSRPGLEAGIFMLLVAPVSLLAMGMAAGSVEDLRGTGELERPSLSARLCPAAFLVMLLSGMSLAGIPPLDGFVGKAEAALALLDRGRFNLVYPASAALALFSGAVAAVALIRMMGGVFGGGELARRVKAPAALESGAALVLAGSSLFIGMFPVVLLDRFVRGGSLVLFPRNFVGPGVVFHGTAHAAVKPFEFYRYWGQHVAAFALVLAVMTLLAYFVSRAACPGAGPSRRTDPFLGGAEVENWPSAELAPRDLKRIFFIKEGHSAGGKLSLGPFDPCLGGPLLLECELEGNLVSKASLRSETGRRGVEAAFEGATQEAALSVAARICHLSSVAHSLAFCQALEDATRLKVEPGAAGYRVVLAELERIASHLEVLSGMGRALEDDVIYMGPRRYLGWIREIFRMASGNPFGFGLVVPGGVAPAGEILKALEDNLGPLARDTRFWEAKIKFSRARLACAVLDPGKVPEEGHTSPAFRASGISRDLRAGDGAYGFYTELGYIPVVEVEGNAYARVRLLLREIRASCSLITKAAGQAEPLRGEIPPSGGKGSGVGICESPGGAVEHRVFMTAEGNIMRARVSCSAGAVASLTGDALAGVHCEDLVPVLLSFYLCDSCAGF